MLGATKLTTRYEVREDCKSDRQKNPGALGAPGLVVVGLPLGLQPTRDRVQIASVVQLAL